MEDLTRVKQFPMNYGSRVIEVFNAMTFGDGLSVLGSSSIRSQLYGGDYDGYEIVQMHEENYQTALKKLAKQFQIIVKRVKDMKDVWIGDIKVGVYDAWRVIPASGRWDVMEAVNKVKGLRAEKIISAEEERDALLLLWEATDEPGMIAAKEGIKFHVIRWTPSDIARGDKTLRDGSKIRLWEAMGTPGITKLDVIAWLGEAEGFTDFSVIYEFKNNDTVLNPSVMNAKKSLMESLIYYMSTGNYFKAIKRMYSLAKIEGDEQRLAKLSGILNGDLGRLYQITSDIDTLTRLLDEHKGYSSKDVRAEIDGFITRLSHIYTLDGYIKDEPRILNQIKRILKLPLGQIKSKLNVLGEKLDSFLQKYSEQYLEGIPSD